MAKKKIEEKSIITSEINIDEIKDDLKDYIDIQIKKNLKEELEKSNKKLLKEKNKKIFWKNVVILLLIGLIIYLLYLLNSVDYFDKFFLKNNSKQVNANIEEKKEQEVKTDEVPTLEDLKKEYSNLIEKININENSEYIKDFYNGDLTSNLKKYLILNLIDFSKLNKEEDYNLIDEDYFKEEYEKLFDDYDGGSFSYNGNKIRYLQKMNSYISTNLLEKIDTNIKREIVDIKVDGEKVYITTVEGLLKDNKLYNIVSMEEVEEYKKELISKYESDLNKITYVFDNKRFVGLNK